ncbi:Rrf2 family transcriptional regulator [Psychrobacter phenylpyruvicus]|uniref:HTH-type transcriptional repressor NsrR n=1 Tax=Psychrobacter phenylpyruvicus TaxID=29432 RepID=A0A379LNB9_9GAMM|nr:Rrf2 family transcriptional regulator [Psychrobacter phenylpyruvicus]SUD91272.1 HTH-type transcriptional repressor NsrR [Psychrobacter phenylpyruvicus]
MRLTNYSDYALRTLMYLAVTPESETLATITDIANSYQISRSHLTKVIHQLAQIGYIESIRGKNGGIRLAKPAEDIVVGEVIRQTEPDFQMVPCFAQVTTKLTGKNTEPSLVKTPKKPAEICEITPVCKLKSVFYQATQAFLQVMDSYTLADIVANEEELWQILKFQKTSN